MKKRAIIMMTMALILAALTAAWADEAEDYLKQIGLTDETIGTLREKLRRDC